jgi:hypothetical protein
MMIQKTPVPWRFLLGLAFLVTAAPAPAQLKAAVSTATVYQTPT